MSRKREVTIGVTINLENYENLRLEVEGSVETREDADDLIAFLDGMLARFGRDDPATADRVDAYRRRVLALRTSGPPGQGATLAPEVEDAATSAAPVTAEVAPAQSAEGGDTPLVGIDETVTLSALEQSEVHEEVQERALERPTPIPEEAVSRHEPTKAKSSVASAEDVCEICRSEVTKSQAKLSRLFMGKTLCKKCMEQP
jgi:hypothetical protein